MASASSWRSISDRSKGLGIRLILLFMEEIWRTLRVKVHSLREFSKYQRGSSYPVLSCPV